MHEDGEKRAPVTMVIGDTGRWKDDRRALPDVEGLYFVDASDLSDETIRLHAPEIILSPLVVRNFDAVDIATTLSEIGFSGRYRVLSNNIPDPCGIEAEVRLVAPGLDFALLNIARPTP